MPPGSPVDVALEPFAVGLGEIVEPRYDPAVFLGVDQELSGGTEIDRLALGPADRESARTGVGLDLEVEVAMVEPRLVNAVDRADEGSAGNGGPENIRVGFRPLGE